MKADHSNLSGFDLSFLKNIFKMLGREESESKVQRIPENVSKNQTSKRGRRPKYTQKDYAPYAKRRKWAQTRRGRQNYILIFRVYQILALNRQKFEWILGATGRGKKMKRGYASPRIRASILAELGRFEDKDQKPDVKAILSAANQICDARMNTRQAVGFCRQLRGKGKPSASSLADLIRSTIKRYHERHPNLSDAEVKVALREVTDG